MNFTKKFYSNETTMVSRSQPMFIDLGYTLDIPWGDVTTAGWQFSRPETWGQEHKLITRPDPEFYAPENILRSTAGIPIINPNDPVYHFQRSDYTYIIGADKNVY